MKEKLLIKFFVFVNYLKSRFEEITLNKEMIYWIEEDKELSTSNEQAHIEFELDLKKMVLKERMINGFFYIAFERRAIFEGKNVFEKLLRYSDDDENWYTEKQEKVTGPILSAESWGKMAASENIINKLVEEGII